VRVNLEGRESQGRIPLDRLDETLDEVEALISACRDPRTGESIVAGFERRRPADPLNVPADHADLLVSWHGTVNGFEHPDLGLIGPVPFRRTGGHTGLHGFCFVAGPGIEAHDYEHRSAFDVAPTVAALAGGGDLDGRPLVTLPDPVS
jgi:predicted AlkP superfamily phosphohydrolase/phosphomutase